jgi:hypothetical protein
LRTIVRTHRFELELQNLLQTGAKAADEFIEAAEWVLSRRAEIGTPVGPANGTDVWFLPIVDIPRADRLMIYYTFDANCIYLLSIQVSGKGANE